MGTQHPALFLDGRILSQVVEVCLCLQQSGNHVTSAVHYSFDLRPALAVQGRYYLTLARAENGSFTRVVLRSEQKVVSCLGLRRQDLSLRHANYR